MNTTQGGEKRKKFKSKVRYKNILINFVLFSVFEKNVKSIIIAVCPYVFYPSLPVYELCTNREIWTCSVIVNISKKIIAHYRRHQSCSAPPNP